MPLWSKRARQLPRPVLCHREKPGAGFGALLLALLLAGCLPSDTRPNPGLALVRIGAASPASELETSDGWTIRYERLLLSFGEVELDGDDCSPYSESDYLRVFDLSRPEAQPVNTLYALGTCDVAFRMQAPGPDAVLGTGVSASDLELLRTPGSDAFAERRGTSFYVRGAATRAGAKLDFEWSFRRDLAYERCGVLTLRSGETLTLELRASTDVLFRSGTGADAETSFEPYAAADADGDGFITLAELGRITLSDPEFPTLAHRLYLGLVPSLPRWGDAPPCPARENDDD